MVPLNKNRQYVNTPTSSERKANLSTPAAHVADSKDHSLESQTKTIEAKVRAANAETKAADAKRYRDTSSKYGEPKPFVGRLPKVQGDKKSSFKIILFLIVLIVSILPTFSKLLDSASNELHLKEWFNANSSQETIDPTLSEETATTAAVDITSNITTELAADSFIISNPSEEETSDYSGIVENIITKDLTNIHFGRDANEVPFLELKLNNGSQFPLTLSKFMNETEYSTYFNDDGTFLDTTHIEFVFTDLTNDGFKELLVYYYTDDAYPTVEVFYNTGNDVTPYKALDFFESYTKLNITSEGIIQRLTDEGGIYDEIQVTSEGVYKVEN